MSKSVSASALCICLILFITGCKKKDHPLSSDAFITSFNISSGNNSSLSQDVNGRFANDTIYLDFKQGTTITNLVPTIIYTGASINPASNIAQNFTNPLIYTVTAQNGNKKTYKIIARYLSNSKDVASFILRKTNNPSLNTDVNGIISGDSIFLYVPPGVDLSSMVPTITSSGTSVSPASEQANDFRFPLIYSVTAEDQSIKRYKVFAGSNRSIYMNSDDGYIYSINGVSGGIQWRYYTGGNSAPTYSNGTVFVQGLNNIIYAINALDGSLKWKSTPLSGILYTLTMPAVYQGKVYFGGSGYIIDDQNHAYYSGFAVAMNAVTGSQEWLDTFYVGGSNTTHPMVENITVNDNVACVYGHAYGGLHAFNANDGQKLWEIPNDLLGIANPVLLNHVIYYGYEGSLGAVQADNGQTIWRLNFPIKNPTVNFYLPTFYSPTINNNVLYGVDDSTPTLYAFDLNGNIIWKVSIGYIYHSAPFVSDSTIYLTTNSNYIEAYSTRDGALKWTTRAFFGNLIVANNEILIYDDKSQLTSLNTKFATVKWASPVKNSLYTPFCVVDVNGTAYHVTDSGDQQ